MFSSLFPSVPIVLRAQKAEPEDAHPNLLRHDCMILLRFWAYLLLQQSLASSDLYTRVLAFKPLHSISRGLSGPGTNFVHTVTTIVTSSVQRSCCVQKTLLSLPLALTVFLPPLL